MISTAESPRSAGNPIALSTFPAITSFGNFARRYFSKKSWRSLGFGCHEFTAERCELHRVGVPPSINEAVCYRRSRKALPSAARRTDAESKSHIRRRAADASEIVDNRGCDLLSLLKRRKGKIGL